MRYAVRKKARWLVGLSLLSTSIAAAATQPLTLNGTVIDTNGAVIAGAHIILRTDFAGGWSKQNFDANVTTDKAGNFALNVGPGFYDLCAMADAFTPQCRKIFIKDRPAAEHFRLAASPEVSGKIGDKF